MSDVWCLVLFSLLLGCLLCCFFLVLNIFPLIAETSFCYGVWVLVAYITSKKPKKSFLLCLRRRYVGMLLLLASQHSPDRSTSTF